MAEKRLVGGAAMIAKGFHAVMCYVSLDDMDVVRKANGKDWGIGKFLVESAMKEIRRKTKKRSKICA